MNVNLEQVFLSANTAIAAGDWEGYRECMQMNPEIVNKYVGGKGLLHAAMPGSKVKFIKDLFENGIDPNKGDPAPIALVRQSKKAKDIFNLFRRQKGFDPENISENSFLRAFEVDLHMR